MSYYTKTIHALMRKYPKPSDYSKLVKALQEAFDDHIVVEDAIDYIDEVRRNGGLS